jgi:NADH dehydrogenase
VTLVDRNNYHLFQPLLYQVATASLSAGDIASPIRSILSRAPRVRTLLGEVTSIDLSNRRVLLNQGELNYDYLIVAAGSSTSYFGHDQWQEVAPTLKTLDDALAMRARILNAFEQAERTTDEAIRQALLTCCCNWRWPNRCGNGWRDCGYRASHLEARFPLHRPGTSAHCAGGSGAPRAGHISRRLVRQRRAATATIGRRSAHRSTRHRDHIEFVQVGEEKIATRNALWTAGVVASPLANALGVPLVRGKVPVEPELNVPVTRKLTWWATWRISVMKRASHCRRGASRHAAGPRRCGKYLAHGAATAAPSISLQAQTTYGHHWPFVSCRRYERASRRGPFRLADLVAGAPVFLIGFDNRMLVLVSWMWSYFTHQRGVRLITGAARRDQTPRSEKSIPALEMASLPNQTMNLG